MHACSVAQSCPTLCNSMDCCPLGSTVHGILQARILEWVAISGNYTQYLSINCMGKESEKEYIITIRTTYRTFDLFLLVSASTNKGQWVFSFSLSEIAEVWTDSSYTPQECWHGKNILRATELKWFPCKTSANVFLSVLWMVVFLFTYKIK